MRFRIEKKLNSISFKTLLAFFVSMILSISLIAFVLDAVYFFKNSIFSETDVNDFAKNFAQEILYNKEGIPERMGLELEYPWLFESLVQEAAYRVIDQSGKVVLYSAAGASFWSSVDIAHPITTGPFKFEHEGVLMDAATAKAENGGKSWFVQLAVSRRFMFFSHDTFGFRFVRSGVVIFSLVLLLVFFFCAHFIVRHTLKPLRELSESAALISPRSLQARLENNNLPTEIAPLVISFNHTLERLEHGYRTQQEFLSTAAHELKTPLALIRTQLELMEETEERNWLLNDANYMSRQVQQLLLLAETSEFNNYNFIVVDIEYVVNEVVCYLQRMAEAVKVNFVVKDYSNGSQWRADRGALFTLLKNLLENSIQHAPAGTSILIAIYSNKIQVRDWGSGIDESQLPLLFTRFWRGDHRRDIGAGLGLSICQEIAHVHDWSIFAQRMEPGLLFQLVVNISDD
ncbi:ATP-binding protein [Vreelandella titanicae]|uniref:ATP-binding protein n=1 Tax=Vreelandella titanicae TaxID=664683 RepID=UPI00315A4A04